MADTQAYLLPQTFETSGTVDTKKVFDFPMGVRIANKILYAYRDKKIDAASLIDKAREKSGLDDFGSDFWRKPMEIIFKDINEHTTLHPLGAFLYEQKVVQNLQNRLWAQYWISKILLYRPHFLQPC